MFTLTALFRDAAYSQNVVVEGPWCFSGSADVPGAKPNLDPHVFTLNPACINSQFRQNPLRTLVIPSSSAKSGPSEVYRLALRVPTLPLPEAGNVQGCAACYDVTEDLGHVGLKETEDMRSHPYAIVKASEGSIAFQAGKWKGERRTMVSRFVACDFCQDWVPIYDKSALPGSLAALIPAKFIESM